MNDQVSDTGSDEPLVPTFIKCLHNLLFSVCVYVEDDELYRNLQSESIHQALKVISKTRTIEIINNRDSLPDGCIVLNINPTVQVHCLLKVSFCLNYHIEADIVMIVW